MKEIGTILGVRFEINHYPVDGFQLTLTDDETSEVYYDNRMIGYTVYEAVLTATAKVWEAEMDRHEDYELPQRVAMTLGLEEIYSD